MMSIVLIFWLLYFIIVLLNVVFNILVRLEKRKKYGDVNKKKKS